MAMKEYYVDYSFPEPEEPSAEWVKAFMNRHNLKTLLSTPLSKDRSEAGSDVSISQWFKDVYTEDIAKQFKPAMIANLDETMLIARNRFLCVVKRDSRYAVIEEDDTCEHVTLLTCATTDGQKPPPFLRVPLKTLPVALDEMVQLKQIMVGGQQSGWVTQTNFKEYCKALVIFVNAHRKRHNYGEEEPFLLFGDSHSSRADPETLKLLKENHITFITFPAHCTHILQPLDVGIFGNFKKHFKKEKRKMAKLNIQFPSNMVPSKKSLQRVVVVLACITALHLCTDILTISRAFSLTGLHPRDLSAALKNPRVNHDPDIQITPKKRKAFSIYGKVLTDVSTIDELEKQKTSIECGEKQHSHDMRMSTTNHMSRAKKRKLVSKRGNSVEKRTPSDQNTSSSNTSSVVGSYGNMQSPSLQMTQASGGINEFISMFQKVKETTNFLFFDNGNGKTKKI